MFASQRAFRKFLVLSFVTCAIGPAFAAAADDWQAGVARAKITPAKFMWMSGYASRNHPADGKLTDLWGKAIWLRDRQGHDAVLITLDLIGIDRELSQSLCRKLKAEHGLRREQIAINASHTHTGPVVGRNLGPLHYLLLDKTQKQLVDEYTDQLERNLINLVAAAKRDLAPARIEWNSDSATFAANRRNNPEAEVPQLREAGKLRGPFDHDVPVLAIRNAENEKLRAVVFGYACHATVLSFYQWSGDYPGFAQLEVESQHPGCVAMFWAGCGGDQNPLPRRKVEHAKEYGKRLAAAVDRALKAPGKPVPANLTTRYREIALSLDTLPERAQIEQDTQSKNKYVAARAKWLLEKLDRGEELSPTYPYPVGVWKLGDDVRFVFLGGEVVVDYAVRLKQEMSGTSTWVAGYSNDVMAYIPSRRVLREGGYEGGGAMVYYGLPTIWSPDVEHIIVETVHALAK